MKQALIDGTVAGCALDGVEGPQWMEAWVSFYFPSCLSYTFYIKLLVVTILRPYGMNIVRLSSVTEQASSVWVGTRLIDQDLL